MSENDEGQEGQSGAIKIVVNSPKTNREVSFSRHFGDDVDEAVGLFGKEVVHSIFVAQAIIKAQGVVRSILDKVNPDGSSKNSIEDAVAAGEAFVPGVVRRSPGKKKENPYDVLARKVKSGEITMEELMENLQEKLGSVEEG